MLIDDLIANDVPGGGTTIKSIIPRLQSAQKFVLTPEFCAVADALAEDYGGLVRTFPHCRLPFPETWIELAHIDRPRFASAPIQAPKFQVRPRRVGYLLSKRRDDLSAWIVHLFWSTDRGCACPAMAMIFDMTRENDRIGLPTAEDNAEINEGRRRRGILNMERFKHHPGWDDASDSVRLTMLRHTKPTTPDYPAPYSNDLPAMTQPEINDFAAKLLDLAAADWAGEPAFIMAVIALMNARNAVETEPVDRTRLNRARVKRGEPPFYEHRLLKIARRQQDRVYGESESRGDHSLMRGHFVRGHWKVRRTGIFFWHPHARGDFGRGKIEKDYELQ